MVSMYVQHAAAAMITRSVKKDFAKYSVSQNHIQLPCFWGKHVALISTVIEMFIASRALSCAEPGDAKVEALHGHPLVLRKLPKTVGGFLINCVRERRPVNPKEWIINVRNYVDGIITGNEQAPDNLYLFCGDATLNLLVEPLSVRASRTFNPYR